MVREVQHMLALSTEGMEGHCVTPQTKHHDITHNYTGSCPGNQLLILLCYGMKNMYLYNMSLVYTLFILIVSLLCS